ncbi:uncharacterized protein LOC108601379 [Drosophila busckii]|uniref:uncharacterized protein LOC108601379 n=1 Tax=Drosophila busckii TaxID=30019 RepID=UPI00083E98C7|nr:uncharacterized protein LOC108601379 [Drosophila busckii]
MHYLGALWLLFILHYAYAQSSTQHFVIYNPASGQQVEPLSYGSNKQETINNNVVQLPMLGRTCSCESNRCKCCLGLDIAFIKQPLCLHMNSSAVENTFQVQVVLNQLTLVDFTFGERSFPGYCIPLMLPLPLFGCLQLRPHIEDGKFYVCPSLLLQLLLRKIFEYKFSCLHMRSLADVQQQQQLQRGLTHKPAANGISNKLSK